MQPEDILAYLHKVLATFDLAPYVAEGASRSFDRLRSMVPYGILNYEIFTAVADLALLTFEQALRDRFLEHHHGAVEFVDLAGADRDFPVSGSASRLNPDIVAHPGLPRHRFQRVLPNGSKGQPDPMPGARECAYT